MRFLLDVIPLLIIIFVICVIAAGLQPRSMQLKSSECSTINNNREELK